MASFGQLMAFVRTEFRGDVIRNGSVLKALLRRYGEPAVEVMLHGARILGWQDLRALNSKEGIGRRWATAAYWQQQKRADWHPPERLKAILWEAINK